MLLFISLVLLNVLASVNGQKSCGNNGNYTSGSTYQSNLNTLLSSLSRNVDQNGFYNASVGENPNSVYALVLCRGDVQLDECRGCVQNATVNLVETCSYQRQATLWDLSCMLRYSDESMFGKLATFPGFNIMWNKVNLSSPDVFNEDLRNLIPNLVGRAAQGGPLRKVAVGDRSTIAFLRIYALVQCTPDLTSEECTDCLTRTAQQLPGCCDSQTCVRMLRSSCMLEYSLQLFYNESRLLELAQSPAPPPSQLLSTPHTPEPGNKGNAVRITISAVSVFAGLILVVLVGFFLRTRLKQTPVEEFRTLDEINFMQSLHYEYDKIRAATNDFSEANKLGQGGFGPVYRGSLQNGQEIAVKRLSMDSFQGDSEFKNEVMLLAKLQHRNLVRLLGFSIQGTEKILVYEFHQNASLDRFIFETRRCSNLDWDKRYKIIMGTAKGILYLHEDSRLTIIHRDLKASNILLDDDMNPKIADFGTARLFVPDETQANTCRIVGTIGYMAPEYAMHGQFSVKSDVFSFGVLLLEIVSGQKNTSFQSEGNGVDFLTRAAWRNWHEGTASSLVDPVLMGSSGISQDILRYIHVGLLCVQQNPADRPTMALVVLMLNSIPLTLPVLSEPAYLVANDYDLDESLTQ